LVLAVGKKKKLGCGSGIALGSENRCLSSEKQKKRSGGQPRARTSRHMDGRESDRTKGLEEQT